MFAVVQPGELVVVQCDLDLALASHLPTVRWSDTLSHRAPNEEERMATTRPRKRAGEIEITIHQAAKIAKKFDRRKTEPITVRQADDGAVIVTPPSVAGDTKPL